MKTEKKTLFENFISLGVLRIFTYIIPFITLPYLSRVLGVEKFGLVFFAQAFIEYFIMLTDYGFELSATKEVAVNRHNKNNLSNIFNSVFIIKLFLFGISFLILLITIMLIPRLHDNWLVFVLSFLLVFGNVIYPLWLFQGIEKMKYITFLNICSKTIFLIFIFMFVKSKEDYLLVPIFNALGFITSGLIGFIFAIKIAKIKLYLPKWNSIKKQLKYSSEFFLSRASVTLFTSTNTFFLGLISNNTTVAYYVAADKIYFGLKVLITPVANALYPFVAKYKDLVTFKKVHLLSLVANIVTCTIVFVFAKEIIMTFYGTDLIESYKILRIFCFGMFISWNTVILSYPLLGALGYTKEVNGSVIFASLSHVTGLIVLYLFSRLSVYSMSYLVLFTEGIILTLIIYFIYKYLIKIKTT